MKRKYNSNEILKYIYGEMAPAEQDAFLDALCEDDELFSEFEQLQETHKSLGNVSLAPSSSSVDKVMHFAGTAARRRQKSGAAPVLGAGGFGKAHLVSLGMVFFTCFMIVIALFVYKMTTVEENNWSNSKDVLKFENDALDQRLQFAKQKLGDIIDNESSAPMPVHHDTYRLVDTDLSPDAQPEVVLLNIK